MRHEPTSRDAFIAWVLSRHVEPVDYDAMEAAVQHLEAQMEAITSMAAGVMGEEERRHGERDPES